MPRTYKLPENQPSGLPCLHREEIERVQVLLQWAYEDGYTKEQVREIAGATEKFFRDRMFLEEPAEDNSTNRHLYGKQYSYNNRIKALREELLEWEAKTQEFINQLVSMHPIVSAAIANVSNYEVEKCAKSIKKLQEKIKSTYNEVTATWVAQDEKGDKKNESHVVPGRPNETARRRYIFALLDTFGKDCHSEGYRIEALKFVGGCISALREPGKTATIIDKGSLEKVIQEYRESHEAVNRRGTRKGKQQGD